MEFNIDDFKSYSNEELAELCNKLKLQSDTKGNLTLIAAVFQEGERRMGDEFIQLLEKLN